jgi:hypothetical protein
MFGKQVWDNESDTMRYSSTESEFMLEKKNTKIY